AGAPAGRPRIGLLVMRAYVLAGDDGHYAAVVRAFEAKGFEVVAAFASGLDARPAIERYFMADGRARVDAVVSLTGFSLVGGPAYNDARAAEQALAALDVPYVAAHALEFQTLEDWAVSDRGLSPVEATMMVAIPELDGATGPIVFGGRSRDGAREMQAAPERAERLVARVAKLTALRRTPPEARRVAVVIYNFPPNGGATGTAAHLDVFRSLWNTLNAMRAAGYDVAPPESPEALRAAVLGGNAEAHGAEANVLARVPADAHVRREPHLAEIEAQWGPAPGRHQADGAAIQVLGARFGSVLVGVQPAFGYEGDPMRLLFEKGFAPTHAFSAFYRHLREDFDAHAILHFGTHGALEFMPGKQSGMCGDCWPDRLIGDTPNIYLYAANNPSEGMIAKRRSAATLISHLTPSVTEAGLYRGLLDLKSSIERWRAAGGEAAHERARLAPVIQEQAAELELAAPAPEWSTLDAAAQEAAVARVSEELRALETALIPHGLHVAGEPVPPEERAAMLGAMAEGACGARPSEAALAEIVAGRGAAAALAADPGYPARAADAAAAAEATVSGDAAAEGRAPQAPSAIAPSIAARSSGGTGSPATCSPCGIS
ncbi:MAG: cobaltochelatase subunit CobN, partial [Pseudomonadota bacterium]